MNALNALGQYLRSRTSDLGITLTELAKRAGKSRQTLYALSEAGARLPEIETLIDLALVLQVHPLYLIHLVFDDYKLPVKQERKYAERGDRSVFLADVTIPDGTVVLAGSEFTKVWDVQNVGTVPWEGRTLRCLDEEVIVYSRSREILRIAEPLQPKVDQVPVPYTPPGGIVRLAVTFTAPSIAGSCVSYWKSFFADGTPCLPDALGLYVKVRVVSMNTTGPR